MAAIDPPCGGRLDCAGDLPPVVASAGGSDGAHRAAPHFSVLRHRVGDEWRIEIHVSSRSYGMMLNISLAEADALAARLALMAGLQPGRCAEDGRANGITEQILP